MIEFIGTGFIDNIKITRKGNTEYLNENKDLYSGDVKIELSKKIIKELDKLPIGSKVGIECTKELIEEFVDDSGSEQIYGKDDRRRYWKAVIEKCRQKSLDVIYLADNNDYKKIKEESKKWTYFDDFQQGVELGYGEMEKFKVEKEGEEIEMDPWDLEEVHRNRFYYCKFVEIPDRIFQKVKDTNPDLVILSKRTLNYFLINRPNLIDYSNIEIRGINLEEVDKENENRKSKNGSTVINYSRETKLVKYGLDNYPEKDEFGYRKGDRQIIIDRYLATSDIQDRSFEGLISVEE